MSRLGSLSLSDRKPVSTLIDSQFPVVTLTFAPTGHDVKPGNILATPEGVAKLGDFGIVHAIDGAGLTRPGDMLGSPHYVSPEIAEGREATPASDLYSLGAVAHEMLTGSKPFDKGTPLAVALAHVMEEPPDLPADVPDDLAATVEGLLAKDPSDRPASAAAVVDLLDDAASD